MEYRTINGNKVSMLGFGCMRFPCRSDGKIDKEKAEYMLDQAMKNGVTYYDTAYPYHNGESEPFLGSYLNKFPRDSYYLATKLPCWKVNTLEDAKQVFAEQLERLQKDYVDFYLLHALSKERWEKMESLGVYDYLAQLKREGKIKNLGFSFHDNYEAFKTILTAKKWDFCQIQYNYMDSEEQAGDQGYELAKSLGVDLVIMEPVKGGSLAALPGQISQHFTKLRPDDSIASWALRWVGSHDNVKVILSGMSTLEQVEDNLATFSKFESLNDLEQAAVQTVKQELLKRIHNGCTGCAYCMPCPAGVNIPYNFRLWNQYGIYENKQHFKWAWKNDIDEKEKALHCLRCGKCETVCPQKLPIREHLAMLNKEFEALCNN